MAHQLARLALQEPNPLQKLVSLGVALHSLADSYSHQDFCGWNCRLNRVRDIKVKGKGRFKKLPMQDIDPSRILEVGHLQAWNLPDQPFRIFRYNAGPPDATVTVTRDNPTQFMLAAQAIYEYLVQASPEKDGAPAWQDISDRVARALLLPSEDKEERCAHWRKVFPQYFKEIDWEYDPRAWRWDAIERDDSFDADGDGSPIAPDPMYLWRGNPDTLPWVAFHWAAAKQRQWVREHMLS